MYKKFFCIFFLVVVISISGIEFAILGNLVTAHISSNKSETDSNKNIAVNLDYAREYPLADIEDEQAVKKISTIGKNLRVINNIERVLQNKVTEDFKYRIEAVLLKNYYQKMLGMDMTTSFNPNENNIKTSTDKVVYYDEEREYLCGVFDNNNISVNLEHLMGFAEYLKNKNINFIYFHAPCLFASNDVYKDHSVEKDNKIISALKSHGIDYIFFNDYMPEEKDEYKKMFYKTDHHWLPSTGIYANKIVCTYLNENYGYNADTTIYEPENYRVEISKLPVLGSWGRKVTKAYVEPEVFKIYHPKYKLDLDVYNSRFDEHTQGNIEDTLFDYSALDEMDIYNRISYNMYGLGNQAYISIHNNGLDDNSHIMLIKTSFANCMYPYLSANFEDIDVIDLRYFGGSVKGFIEEKQPDTIIMIYGLSAYDYSHTMMRNLFDFR